MKNPLKSITQKTAARMARDSIKAIEKKEGKETATAVLVQTITQEMMQQYTKNPSWDADKLSGYDDKMMEFCAEYDITHEDLLSWAKVIIREDTNER